MKSAKSVLTSALIFSLLFTTFKSSANNLDLDTAITVVSGNEISFTIKWDNSWNTGVSAPNNWDAVWIFVKYKDCATTNWLHAPLSTTLGDHSVSGGGSLLSVEMPAVNDSTGVFIRRTAAGSGDIATAETITLKLGIPTGTYNFKVFGIEMVSVPQNNFDVGDGASTGTFNGTGINITSEGALTAANLGGTPAAAALPAAFPKGFNSFYSMKYEVTQEQYVDFLNTLTYDQQVNHTTVAPSVMATNFVMGPNSGTVDRSRNGIKMITSGVASTSPAEYGCDLSNNGTSGGANYNGATDGQNIPMNYMSWTDLTAYLDWACLRPMTELEFEKSCRGVAGRVGGEYIWGSVQITRARITNGSSVAYYTNYGASNEGCTLTGNGLCAYGYPTSWSGGTCNMSNRTTNPWGKLESGGGFRVGFAATASTNRISAGATYYGAMDMGGNVAEQTVQTNADGSAYTGGLGDGTLDASGYSDVANWPAATGTILRGGDWYNSAGYVRTSNRNQGTAPTTRDCKMGGRGVR